MLITDQDTARLRHALRGVRAIPRDQAPGARSVLSS